MRVPEEFDKFLTVIFDFDLEESPEHEFWTVRAIRRLSKEERAVLSQFIGSVLAKNLSQKELIRLWNDHTQSFYLLDDSRADILFAFIRDKAAELSREK